MHVKGNILILYSVEIIEYYKLINILEINN